MLVSPNVTHTVIVIKSMFSKDLLIDDPCICHSTNLRHKVQKIRKLGIFNPAACFLQPQIYEPLSDEAAEERSDCKLILIYQSMRLVEVIFPVDVNRVLISHGQPYRSTKLMS